MLKNLTHYLQETLWNFSLSEKSGFEYFKYKWARIIVLSVRSFFLGRCTFGASSLTYFSLISVVPIFALGIAVARGFGYRDLFQTQLLQRFPDQSAAFTQAFIYADAFLQEARGGILAGIGIGILFLSVLFLLHDLEAILNDIWKVKKHRSWRRIFTDYLAILLFAPVFFVLASSFTVFIVEYLGVGVQLLPLKGWVTTLMRFLISLIPYCLFWILFAFIYKFMPNTKVRFKSAALGALVASILYVVTQWIYINFQVGAGRYGAVYGTMAALPLFLIWLQISWYMVLFGAELSCAHQKFMEHEYEVPIQNMSHSTRRLLNLWMAHVAVRKGDCSIAAFEREFHIPRQLSEAVLQELSDCNLLHHKGRGYVPDQSTGEMKISELLIRLDTKGENHFPFMDPKLFEPFHKTLESFKIAIEKDPQNTSLKDVPDTI